MKEAKKRNPEIKLYTLAWTAPGWIGTSEGKPGEFYSQDNIDYHMKWIKGLKSEHNLTLDYMGIWNEHTYDTDWIVRFRNAMDADPDAAKVEIVASDQVATDCAGGRDPDCRLIGGDVNGCRVGGPFAPI